MSSRNLILPLLLLAAIAAVFALWRGSGADAPTPPGPGDGAVEPRGDGPRAPQVGTAAEQLLSVTVELIVRGQILPPEDGVLARLLRGGERFDLGSRIVDAGPRGASALRGRHLVRFELADGSACCRDVVLRDDVTAELDYGPRRVVGGRVLDARREVVADAVVWAGEIAADGSLRTVRTDGDGRFELDVPAGTGVPIVVRAPGNASTWRRIEVGPDGALGLSIRLASAARMELVLGAVVADATRGRFWLGAAQADAGLTDYPFFLATLEGRDRFDAAGRAALDDLPEHCEITCGAIHPEALAGEPKTIVTGRRHARPVVLTMTPAQSLSGSVVDAASSPAAGVEVRIAGGAPVRSDANGGFRVAWSGDREALVELRPDRGAGLRVDARALSAGGTVRLPPPEVATGEPTELVLRVPEPGVRWRARLAGRSWQEVAQGGSFTVLRAGPELVDVLITSYRGARGEPREDRIEALVLAGTTVIDVPAER